jgi:hypothetical protein
MRWFLLFPDQRSTIAFADDIFADAIEVSSYSFPVGFPSWVPHIQSIR